jgi:signal transduction histidine kinase
MASEGSLLAKIFNRAVSLPVFFKIIGTGIIVACTFGSIVLYQSRQIFRVTLYAIMEKEIKSLALMLVSNIQRPYATGDFFLVRQRLQDAMKVNPEVCYGIIEDRSHRILVHTFPGPVAHDLVRAGSAGVDNSSVLQFEVLTSSRGVIFEASAPILLGAGGWLRLGLSDQMVKDTLSMLTRLLLVTLGFCMTIGMTLALYLTYLISRPVHNLLETTKRIGRGDFTARATVFFKDEIGQLAAAFNQMGESLEAYTLDVQEKERTLQALIEKIVGVQEDERKRIAQDLHDHLGQMLSVLLLDIQESFDSRGGSTAAVDSIRKKINTLIDEVRRLAWGLRPAILDDYGLDTALTRYVQEISRTAMIKFDYQYMHADGVPERLPLQVEIVLYRIAQEAITNILRHSCARTASVIFIRGSAETMLLIEDDGKGFTLKKPEHGAIGHLGLTGMRERAALIGAAFTVESCPGKGTVIRVKLPAEEEIS